MSVVEKDVTMGWHATVAHDLLWVFDIWGWIGNLEAQTDQSSSFPSMDGLVRLPALLLFSSVKGSMNAPNPKP